MMKKILLIVTSLVFSTLLFAESPFNKIVVETPCRIILNEVSDSTLIINHATNDINYVIKNNTMFITKSQKSNIDEENLPLIRIYSDKSISLETKNQLKISSKKL